MRRTNLLLGGAVAAAAVMAHTSGAWAQSAPTAPTERETQFTLSSDIYYDSNAARSDAQLAAQRGLVLSEAIFEPSGTFTIARQAGRFLAYVDGDGGYDIHSQNKIRDHEHINVDGGLSGRVARCLETVTGGYSSAQSDLSELTLGVITNNRERESVDLSVNCARPVGIAPSLTVGESWTSNSAAIERIVDTRTFHVNGAIGYQRPGLGVATVFGGYSEITYPNRGLPIGGGATGFTYNLYEGGGRFERHVGARIDTSLSVSYSVLDAGATGGSGFHGLTFALDGTYHLTSRLALHANGARATMPSTRVNADFEVSELYEADIDYKLGARLDFKLTGDWRRENFVGRGANLPGYIDLTVETTYDAIAALTFNLNRRLSFILSVGEEQRDANFPGLTYDSTTVGLTAKATF